LIANICGNWELPINVDLKNEDDLGLHSRSYIHYAATHKDLVSAKCWATKWLLETVDIDKTKSYSVVEYFSGIGVMTTIIRNIFNIQNHFALEMDLNCCDQIRDSFPDVTVGRADFKKLARMEADYDLKFLDFPSSSIAQLHTKWKIENFLAMFSLKPKIVVWTDTSVCYPMTLHGKSYQKYFGTTNEITSVFDYLTEFSTWLFDKTGYTITTVAQRANNALYIAAVPGDHRVINFKKFDLRTYGTGGFVLNDAANRTLV
jgi:hypothetical protein